MTYRVTVLPGEKTIIVPAGKNLLAALRDEHLAPDAPCGGRGTCGKCIVFMDGQSVKACSVTVDRDMTVALPQAEELQILTTGIRIPAAGSTDGYRLAFDIGTTTVAGTLLAPNGNIPAVSSAKNPQAAYGADVVSRISAALDGSMNQLTAGIRELLQKIALELCARGSIHPEDITLVSVVGNPAMQQLFLGLSPENLARPPFAPVLTRLETQKASCYLPCLSNARILIVPNISGFVGADTLGCMLALGMDNAEEITLLVDIGTNGELVLGNRNRLISCSTAAGPALEGGHIQFGMRAQPGAIDHVRIENGALCCHVIGSGEATGICGSGLIDAVAGALDLGLLNSRGKILSDSQTIPLTDTIFLTQEDIRQIQLAKGAIAAGIRLLAQRMGIIPEQIQRICLAGAFGTYLDPDAACRMGLLPRELSGRIEAVGNAALSGAQLLALDHITWERAQRMADRTEALDLSTAPDFPRSFAKSMRFDAASGGIL